MGEKPPAPQPSPAPRPLRWAPRAHPAASQTGRREWLSLDMWEVEQLSCPPPSGGARGANRPHAPHPSTSIREACREPGLLGTRERRWASLLCERPLIRQRSLSPMTSRHCAGQHAPRKGRRAVIDQAPPVSLSLWTFKGTIWHPERAIDERQLTPLWPPPGGRWMGPRGGRWEARHVLCRTGLPGAGLSAINSPPPSALKGKLEQLLCFLINYSHPVPSVAPRGPQHLYKSG